MTGSSTPVKYRFAGRDELSRVYELVRICYGERAESFSWWEWRYFGAGSFASELCVAESGEGVVGVQPITWTPYHYGESALLGGVLTGVMVHPEWRRRGLFSGMIRACAQRAWDQGAAFLMTMPNERSLPGFRKLGWTEPGERSLYVRILNGANLGSHIIRPAAVGKVLGWSASRALSLLAPNRCSVNPLPLKGSLIPSNDVTAPREEADALRVVQDLTPDWLHWRFDRNPDRIYEFRTCGEDSGLARGWICTTCEVRDGLPTGYLLELAGRAEALESLLADAESRLRAQGAAVLLYVGNRTPAVKAMRKAGYWRVPRCLSPKRFYFCCLLNPERTGELAALRNLGHWSLSLADWDGL